MVPRFNFLLYIGCLVCPHVVEVDGAFGVTPTHRQTITAKPKPENHVARLAARRVFEFDGRASASMSVTVLLDDEGDGDEDGMASFPEWLATPHLSDRFLLGTPHVERWTKDGNDDQGNKSNATLYRTVQPGIPWLGGVQLTPVLILSVERSPNHNHRIHTKIIPHHDKPSQQTHHGKGLQSKFLHHATFRGGNRYVWHKSANNKWTLEATVSLKMSLHLPAYLPLPPGFQTIATRIVQSTCQRRVQQTLEQLVQAYYEWRRQSVHSMMTAAKERKLDDAALQEATKRQR